MNTTRSSLAPSPFTPESTPEARPRCSAEACLQAVVHASRCLLGATDLASSTQAAVQALQTHTGLDRVYVFADAPNQQGAVLYAEAQAPGVPSVRSLTGDRVLTDADFPTVLPTLRAGRLYQSVHPQRAGENADLNAAGSTRSDLMIPVLVHGRFWGLVGFDDCRLDREWDAQEVLALQGAAVALAAAVKRDAAETTREQERLRYEALLRAAAVASQHLVANDDLPQALDSALGALRFHTQADRVFLNRYASDEQATYFWLESRREDLPPFEAGFGPGPWPDDDFPEVAHPLREGRVYRSTAASRSGANREANQSNGSLSDLIVPIMVDGHYRACLGFDDNTRTRRWTDAEVAVLQTAASAIAAALAQDEVRTARAREAAALSLRERLLAAVAQSLEFLLGDADDNFAAAVHHTLAALGRACGIHRVRVLLQRVDATSGQPMHRLEHEWWAPGLASQTNLGLTEFPDTLIADWLQVLRAGQVHCLLVDEASDTVRTELQSVGVHSVGAVPIFGGAKYLGLVAFDDCVSRRVWSDAEIDALTAAARTLGAAIHRHALQQVMLAEREARIGAEQARADSAQQLAARIERHSRLLAAVAAAAEDLLACADPADCMDAVLARVGEVTHAERVCLARLEWTPQDAALHGWQEIAFEWARPGAARQIDGPLRRFAMQRGDATWDRCLQQFATERRILATMDSLDEPFRSDQLALGVVWTVCYPVLLQRQVWGLLGMDFATAFADYDEADLAALQTVATTIADAQMRRTLEQRAIASARARIQETRALNRLLESVVQSSRELLDATDFQHGLQQWLRVLAVTVDADVALIGSLAPDAEGETLAQWSVYWAKSGQPYSTPPVPPTTDFTEWHARLKRGESVWAHRENLLDPVSLRYWQETNCWTNLLMPIISASGTLGFLCFDWHERREWQPAYGTVLRTAADSVAAAIQRHQATQALLTERDRRIATETQNAQENARLAALIAHMVRSSRELIDTELQGFELALHEWLGSFGQATRAIRTTFYDLTMHEPTGQRTLRMLCEWVRDGVGGSLPVSFAQPHVIDPRGAEAVMDQLTSGEPVVVHTWDTTPPMRDFLEHQGTATVVAVPLFVGGRQWGSLSFDHAERTQPSPGELAVLQSAADTLSAILRRNETMRELLTERENRLEQEQRRSADLARANQALQVSLAALAETQSEAGFVRQCLVQLSHQSQASAAYLFAYDEPPGLLRLIGATAAGVFHPAGLPDDPPMFRSGFQCDPALRTQLMTSGRLLWRLLEAPVEQREYAAVVHRWQAQRGYRADALHALIVGKQMVGLVALEFNTTEPPSGAQQELTHTLCQTLTLSIELARLGALAKTAGERAAVLSERQRMAGEIHDNLAQSFTSIAMQSESLAGRLAGEAESARVLRLIERTARQGLAEARSSVLALTPTAGAAGSLDEALAELAARSSVPSGIQCRFSGTGVPVQLATAVREALLRIAQEATSNAMRHSRGSQIVLHLAYTPAAVLLSVEDDGNGPGRTEGLKQNGGFGMAGMQSRAAAVGAQLHLAVASMGGYCVQVRLPLEPQEVPT